MNLEDLAGLLKGRREKLGLSRATLARTLEISPSYVWMVENAIKRGSGRPARPSTELLQRWVVALHLGQRDEQEVLSLAGHKLQISKTGVPSATSPGKLTPTPPVLAVVTGPSGAGKDSLLDRLQELGLDFYSGLEATTRPPRLGEESGVDYVFMSTEEFATALAAGEFIEHTEVYGRAYGTLREPIMTALSSGRDVILKTDVRTALNLRNRIPGSVAVFIFAPEEELISRLANRSTEVETPYERRLQWIHEDMEMMRLCDYVIANRDSQLDQAAFALQSILVAEKHRVARQGKPIFEGAI